MGLEADCYATWNGTRSAGKALLETNELIFRGTYRAKILFADMKSVSAVKGLLKVKTAEGLLELELGKMSAKWAEKIANPKSRIDKLGVKEGHRVQVLDVADELLMEELRLRKAVIVEGAALNLDMIFVGFDSAMALRRIPKLLGSIRPDGAIWAIYAKADDEIKEGSVRDAFRALEMRDVKVTAFSATHTSLKFVVPLSLR